MITLKMIEKYSPCYRWVKGFKKLTKDEIDIVELLIKLEKCEVVEGSCWDGYNSDTDEDATGCGQFNTCNDEAFKCFIYKYILQTLSKEDFNRVIEYHKQMDLDLRWILEFCNDLLNKQQFLDIMEYLKKTECNYNSFDFCNVAFEFCNRHFTKENFRDIMKHYQKLIWCQPVHKREKAKRKAFGKAFSCANSMRSLPFFREVVDELGIEDPHHYKKEKFIWLPSVEQQQKNWEAALVWAKSQNLYKSY